MSTFPYQKVFVTPFIDQHRAEDVEAGVCLYAVDDNGEETNDLLQVPDSSQIDQVQQGLAPYLQGCNRCADLNNYDEDDGTCTCTPTCGSCASNEKEDHNADLSGKYNR